VTPVLHACSRGRWLRAARAAPVEGRGHHRRLCYRRADDTDSSCACWP